MVPAKEFDQLVQYYKGEITENALLNKAGRLAAESHVILRAINRFQIRLPSRKLNL